MQGAGEMGEGWVGGEKENICVCVWGGGGGGAVREGVCV